MSEFIDEMVTAAERALWPKYGGDFGAVANLRRLIEEAFEAGLAGRRVMELPEPVARSPKGNTWQVTVDNNPVTFEASLHWDDNSPVVETDFAIWDPAELRAHSLAALAAADNAEQLAVKGDAR